MGVKNKQKEKDKEEVRNGGDRVQYTGKEKTESES